jgi:hypothetical protein
MKNKIMISLSGRNQAWFDKLSKRDQKEYLKAHPKSKFHAGAPTKTKSTKTVKEKAKVKPAAVKKTVKKDASKVAVKKKASSVKGVQRKGKAVVHPETNALHEHALKQKKALIDGLVAPYAKALSVLRNKRDAGEGLTNDESKRYKQLLVTIAHLHKGR